VNGFAVMPQGFLRVALGIGSSFGAFGPGKTESMLETLPLAAKFGLYNSKSAKTMLAHYEK
jgi:hypothetical protein